MIRYLLLLAGISLMSCSRPSMTPFTSGLIEENQWSESELSQIQFYLSQDVVLEREYRQNGAEIVMGEIIQRGDRQVDRITFRAGTPGVLLQMTAKEKLAISFEPGDDQKFLVFTPHPKKQGVYLLAARNWEGGRGQVNYGGQYFYTIPGSGLASLMVDMKSENTRKVTSRQATGRTVH